MFTVRVQWVRNLESQCITDTLSVSAVGDCPGARAFGAGSSRMAAVLGWTTFVLGAWLGVYALLWSAGAGRLGGPWALTWVFTELVCGVDARVTGHLAT